MSVLAAIFSPDATTRFSQIVCCHEGCGCIFAVPSDLQKRFRNTHEWFYCPFGHQQHYSGLNEVEQLKAAIVEERRTIENLKDDLKWERDRKAELHDANRHIGQKLAATKGVVTRIKRRIGRGVCPCCNRRFEQLARHMAAKHPEYHQAADDASASQPDGKTDQ